MRSLSYKVIIINSFFVLGKENCNMKKEDWIQKLKNYPIKKGKIESVKWVEKLAPAISILKFVEAENFYKIIIKLYPTLDSDITVLLALPEHKDWNRKFLGVGNGGFAGTVDERLIVSGVKRGYAVAHTDMGTTPDPDDCIGRPERWIDFGYRATHLMTLVGKQIAEFFYGAALEHSYFMGGSTGGQQAMSEIQRYPEDYDGIICFSPANNRIRLHSFFVWNWQAVHSGKDTIFTEEQVKMLKDEIVQRYGAQAWNAPGDGFLAIPQNISVDVDKMWEETEIFNEAQRDVLKKLYAGPEDPLTKERIISGFVPGTEGESLSIMDICDKEKFAHGFFYPFRWIWGKDFDFMKFDFHKDLQDAIRKLGPILDAVNPDISAFRERGGKMIMISGLSDAIIPYGGAEEYYEQVISLQGTQEDSREEKLYRTKHFFRYFQVPGFAHTFGGPGVQELGNIGLPEVPVDPRHDVLCALENWVENEKAPECLLATALKDNNLWEKFDHDRPVYAYPDLPRFISGDPKCKDNYERQRIDI